MINTTVNTAAKDILARLLASEDLTVRHDPKAETAYFDTKNRVLCLPVWQDMDSFMYDMLVGHEVAHALYTPTKGWQDFVGDDRDSHLRQLCLNICEDARIERKIKDKFPGLRRDFAKAYKTLHERDIFEMKGKSIDDMSILDRINLYYKGEIYGQMTVPFSTDEKVWIERLDSASSFKDVVSIASDLFDLIKEDVESPEESESTTDSQVGVGEGSGGSDESDKGDSDEQSNGGSMDMPNDENTEDQEDGNGSGVSSTDDTDDDDDESTDSTDGESGSENGTDLSYESYSNNASGPGVTQHNYDKARSDLRDSEAGEWLYYDVPEANLDKIIIPHDRIASLWSNWWGSTGSYHTELLDISNSELADFTNRSKPIISHMVQQFQQKQAAEASKRSYTAKTGVLDTTAMINYRWSEDIFLKNEVHPDGKSHGIVMFLDWSGSMSGILKDTVEQLIILVEFCRKAGIPYDVHAFTSNLFTDAFDEQSHQEVRESGIEADLGKDQFNVGDGTLQPHSFQLLNFLNSKQNARQHSEAIKNLYYLSMNGGYRGPRALSMGSTPLNEAIVASLSIVPKFQNEHGIQIVNTVFLTDGDGHCIVPYGRYYSGSRGNTCERFIVDPKTKKNYSLTGKSGGDTSVLLNILRDRTGSSTIGIRLHDSNSIRGLQWRYFDFNDDKNYNDQLKKYEAACKEYRTGHHFACDFDGYDLHLVVKGNLKVQTNPLEDLDTDATKAKIRNAFIKGGNRKKSSRVISNRLVDLIAVG